MDEEKERYINEGYPQMKQRAREAIRLLKLSAKMRSDGIIEPQRGWHDLLANGVNSIAQQPGAKKSEYSTEMEIW
jgi:hypothetical protein